MGKSTISMVIFLWVLMDSQQILWRLPGAPGHPARPGLRGERRHGGRGAGGAGGERGARGQWTRGGGQDPRWKPRNSGIFPFGNR